jgi:hypothetical protein
MMNASDLGKRLPVPVPAVITVADLRALADRLDTQATVIAGLEPERTADLKLAARFCRHALRVGWFTTSIAVQ